MQKEFIGGHFHISDSAGLLRYIAGFEKDGFF